MAKNNFRKGLLENAKKVKGTSTAENLTPGEKYILERKKSREPVTEELTLGQRLLQERLEGKPIAETSIITESVETPVVSEDVQETAQMISEVSEAMPEQRGRRITPDTEDGRLLEYLDTIKSTTETSQQKSLIEQDLQNTAATMADLANLRSVVTRLQTSLTSLGGGGIGYQEVKQMIEDGDYNIDSADLANLQNYIDSALDGIEPFDVSFAAKTTDDLTQGAVNLYYGSSLFDADFVAKNTDDLSQGLANKYYDSSLFNADFTAKSTDDLSEGANNLYYTQARVITLVDSDYVQERVSIDTAVHFKGVVNFATDSAPVDPEAGDMYIADSDAVANASWVGIAGDTIVAQHGVIWANADSSWHELGSTSVDASVYVERSGDTMTGKLTVPTMEVSTGKLTTQNMEVKGGLLINSPNRNINVEFGEGGKLQYEGGTRLKWGNSTVTVTSELVINDGVNYVGGSVTGKLNMNNKFIVNLPDPTNNNHAANKQYVDDNFVALTGDQSISGVKTFTSTVNLNTYAYLTNSSVQPNGLLRRDTIEAMIASASSGGDLDLDYKITKSGSNYYIESI